MATTSDVRAYGTRLEDWRARRELAAVEAARDELRRAQGALEAAVATARARGATESAIARASGLSRTTVRAWLARGSQSSGSGAQR